jgi:hypothetical protein
VRIELVNLKICIVSDQRHTIKLCLDCRDGDCPPEKFKVLILNQALNDIGYEKFEEYVKFITDTARQDGKREIQYQMQQLLGLD